MKIASKPGSKDSLRFFENFPRALITASKDQNVGPFKMILDTFTSFCRNIYSDGRRGKNENVGEKGEGKKLKLF